jgi:hypothetical protein
MKLALGLLAFAVGCGSSPTNPSSVDAPKGSGDAPGAIDAQDNTGWTTIAARSWTLNVGDHDKYECTRVQIPEDTYIIGFRALSPLGTHHSVLTISTTSTTVGDYDCSAGSLDFQMLYAAGVDTDDLMFPTNVAMKVPAGSYVNLNLHLFNASDNPESGMSGVLIKSIPASSAASYILADMTFSGTEKISIPSDNMPHTAVGGCTAPNDWHLFTLWPHMHQLANHQSLAVNGTKLLDTDYSFFEQRNYPMADTLVHKGDSIQTTCTYVNNTGATVQFGDSSTDEMCFTGLYKYPAGGNLFQCALN